MSDRCPICGEWLFKSEIWGKPHKCSPSWWCWISDPRYGGWEREDGRVIYNQHPEEAASEFIERWDADGDYVCIGGDEIQVSVAPMTESDHVQVFVVRGEMVPQYIAKPVRKPHERQPA